MTNHTAPKSREQQIAIENGIGSLSVPADRRSLDAMRVPNIATKKNHRRKKSSERKMFTGGQIVHGRRNLGVNQSKELMAVYSELPTRTPKSVARTQNQKESKKQLSHF